MVIPSVHAINKTNNNLLLKLDNQSSPKSFMNYDELNFTKIKMTEDTFLDYYSNVCIGFFLCLFINILG